MQSEKIKVFEKLVKMMNKHRAEDFFNGLCGFLCDVWTSGTEEEANASYKEFKENLEMSFKLYKNKKEES